MLVVTFLLTAHHVDVDIEELPKAFPQPVGAVFQSSQCIAPADIVAIEAEVGVNAVLGRSPRTERDVQNGGALQHWALVFNKLDAGVILEFLEVLLGVGEDGLLVASLPVVVIVLLAVTLAHLLTGESKNIREVLISDIRKG